MRSSAAGSPTLNIGFTAAGDLDTVALKTFVGTNSAFVTTWYDQSTNGRNATQATPASQPRIMNAGTIERQNTMPAIRWLGLGYALTTAPFTGYLLAACFNGVGKVNTDLTYNTIVNKTNGNLPAPLDSYNNQAVIGNGSSYVFGTWSQSFAAATPMGIWTFQSSILLGYNLFYNGANAGSGTAISYGDAGNPLSLGSRIDGTTGLDGWISEVVTFAALPSTTERQFLEWSQAQYYSISGPALSTLPSAPSSGFVSIWYDQSGNNLHATQSATLSQPRIINAGVIDKNGLNPAIFFGGNPQNLVAPLPVSSYPVSFALLANTAGALSNGAFVKMGTSVNGTDGGVAIGIGASATDFDNSGTSVIGLKEWVTWCPSSPNINYPSTPFVSTTIQQAGAGGMLTYLNGTNVPLSNATNTVGATISGSLFIGGYVNVSNRYPLVKESELSVFASALPNSKRILIESNEAAYNGVTLSGTKYTPPATNSYNRFVTGVGRESATDSVSGTRYTAGMGFIVGQTANDFLKDNGDYLTAGISCPITSGSSTTNLPGTIVARWANDWYLEKTDVGSNSGTVTVYFDFQDYGVAAAPGTAANYELLFRNTTAANFTIVAATTKSVTGSRVYFTLNTSALTNHFYYTIGTKNASASPLPVDLLSFEAACNGNAVDLSWSTATQSNNKFFTVERTLDGVIFQSIGTIKGAGTTSKLLHYMFTDASPVAGTSYYRLRQTDYNGDSKSFKIVMISCTQPRSGINIYPNPNDGYFIVEGLELNTDISVINSLGETVAQQKSSSSKQALDLSSLHNGVYFLKVGNDMPVIKKLVIQR